MDHLEWQANQLRAQEAGEETREVGTGMFAVIGAVLFAALTAWILGKGGWWWSVAAIPAVLTLVFISSVASSFTKKVRPAKEPAAATCAPATGGK